MLMPRGTRPTAHNTAAHVRALLTHKPPWFLSLLIMLSHNHFADVPSNLTKRESRKRRNRFYVRPRFFTRNDAIETTRDRVVEEGNGFHRHLGSHAGSLLHVRLASLLWTSPARRLRPSAADLARGRGTSRGGARSPPAGPCAAGSCTVADLARARQTEPRAMDLSRVPGAILRRCRARSPPSEVRVSESEVGAKRERGVQV